MKETEEFLLQLQEGEKTEFQFDERSIAGMVAEGIPEEIAKSKKSHTDKFGTRIGTIHAKMNAVITRKPKTYKQILADAKIEPPEGTHYRKHLKKMCASGHIERIQTYVLK